MKEKKYFNRKEYVRPSNKWICGNAKRGCPCQIGPDNKGRCRATFQCQPRLELKEGNTKGRYYCTRVEGVCEMGPLPDGTCCNPIPKCTPIRSIRSKRAFFSLNLFILVAVSLIAVLSSGWRHQLINPGPLSKYHSKETLTKFYKNKGLCKEGDLQENCSVCHKAADLTLGNWVDIAWKTQQTSLHPSHLLLNQVPDMKGIESACVECHQNTTFHQVSIETPPSCWSCHEDHKGINNELASDDTQCVACHGSASIMAAAGDKREQLLPSSFNYTSCEETGVFKLPCSPRGFTQVITAFDKDHPEFRIHKTAFENSSHLKFDHAKHLSASMPKLNGQALECASCHKQDSSSDYFKNISFANHCQECHALQFDVDIPEMHIPHENTQVVRAYIRSLPQQYEEYAYAEKGLVRAKEIREFVDKQMQRIRDLYRSHVSIENAVFFGENIVKSSPLKDVKGTTKAAFDGCILCHELSSKESDTVEVLPVDIKKRWMPQALFDHRTHSTVTCLGCHQVNQISTNLGVSFPGIEACTDCHNTGGKIMNQCVTCHKYHHMPPTIKKVE